jgi:hypothetical protein
MPVKGRIAGHVRLLGILWIALSAFRMVPTVALFIISNPALRIFPPETPDFIVPMLRAIGTVLLIGSAAGIAAGWGLLGKQPWARMLAIIIGCISLLDMPFGTALGVYTFWVLLPAQSEEEYRRMSGAA